ncbi:MAG: amidohydrolase family protein [Anaerolineae bacterium]|nr:amidohydrolase family protein [Anaerolineae bacterium]
MIIDAHNHPDWHGHNLQKFLQNMETCHIDKTWLLTWECPPDEYDPAYHSVFKATSEGPLPFARCLHYKEHAPDKFVLGYAPDPRRPNAIDQLQAAIEIYGVQVYGELKLRVMYDNPDVLRMFRFCGEKGLPVTVHIDYEFDNERSYPRPNWWYGGGIEAFARAVRACPETIFIGHAPGFWAHISNDDQFDKAMYPKGPVVPGGKLIDLFRQCANLYADLSANSARNALTRDPAFGKDFILEFQDRLLYGRDCFDNELQTFLNGLDLAADVLEKLYAGNAQRLVPVTTN